MTKSTAEMGGKSLKRLVASVTAKEVRERAKKATDAPASVAGKSNKTKSEAMTLPDEDLSWIEMLPQGPFDKICRRLCEDSADDAISNLRMASKTLQTQVDCFVERVYDRPVVDFVKIERGRTTKNLARMFLEIRVANESVPMIPIRNVDWSRLDRKIEEVGGKKFIVLRESLHKDQKLKDIQVRGLLRGHIANVKIRNYNHIAMEILKKTTVGNLKFFGLFDRGYGKLTDDLGQKIKNLVEMLHPTTCEIEADHVLLRDRVGYVRDLNNITNGGLVLSVHVRSEVEMVHQERDRINDNR